MDKASINEEFNFFQGYRNDFRNKQFTQITRKKHQNVGSTLLVVQLFFYRFKFSKRP